MTPSALRALPLCALFTSSACFRAPVPMEKIDYPTSKPPARCLVMLMPGAGSNDEDFEKEGFLKVLQDSGLSIDVVAANATLGYYFNETMIPRAHDDVFAPEVASKPYEKKWLIGMSMGGFGSLFFSSQFPGEVDGVYALAPWLGSDSLVDEIRTGGGLKTWKAPPKEERNSDNYQRQLWRFLQEVSNAPDQKPTVYLGYGSDDSLGPNDKVFADALPPNRVGLAPGGHEWPVWNTLLARFLKEGPLATDCAATGTNLSVAGPMSRAQPWWMKQNSFKMVVLGKSARPHVDAAP